MDDMGCQPSGQTWTKPGGQQYYWKKAWWAPIHVAHKSPDGHQGAMGHVCKPRGGAVPRTVCNRLSAISVSFAGYGWPWLKAMATGVWANLLALSTLISIVSLLYVWYVLLFQHPRDLRLVPVPET